MFSLFMAFKLIVFVDRIYRISDESCNPEKSCKSCLRLQPKSFQQFWILLDLTVYFVNYRKTSRVVPHGPTDAVLLQRQAHVLEPHHTIYCLHDFAKGAKLIT